MKKTLIICGTIVLAAVIALVLVVVLKADDTAAVPEKGDMEKGQKVREFVDMTYEEFTKGMDENLSYEVQTQVDALYEEYQGADQERRALIFRELLGLGVYEGKSLDKGEYDAGDKVREGKK
jgi:hypothetical protein